MKTFFNLIQEVQKPGLCHRCGGCVTFCTAINYGALALDEDGKPTYADIEKCIECGLCYAICPEIDDLEEETLRRASWSAPMGRTIETTVLQAGDDDIRRAGTDGGVVTALLLHLLDRGRIDGAIVAKQVGPFQRRPFLATTAQDIADGAGFFFDTSHGLKAFSDAYMTYSSIEEFDPMVKAGLKRVALVGTPCQIKSVRRMQAMGIVPSDAIQICLGLFCAGNFQFGDQERRQMAEIGRFDWADVVKVNVKERFIFTLASGAQRFIDLDAVAGLRRYACQFCTDYSAEVADISFGGIGAADGWTTVITRSPLGRAVIADAKGEGRLAEFRRDDDDSFASNAMAKVRTASSRKKKAARHNRRALGGQAIEIRE